MQPGCNALASYHIGARTHPRRTLHSSQQMRFHRPLFRPPWCSNRFDTTQFPPLSKVASCCRCGMSLAACTLARSTRRMQIQQSRFDNRKFVVYFLKNFKICFVASCLRHTQQPRLVPSLRSCVVLTTPLPAQRRFAFSMWLYLPSTAFASSATIDRSMSNIFTWGVPALARSPRGSFHCSHFNVCFAIA